MASDGHRGVYLLSVLIISAFLRQVSATHPVTIGLLVGLHSPGCHEIAADAVQQVEAVNWIINHLNNVSYIPGVNLKLVTKDTCSESTRAVAKTVELMREFPSPEDSPNDTNSTRLMALIGPTTSEEMQSVSSFLSSLKDKNQIVQLGYSTTVSGLADRTKYNNFFRVIPPDSLQTTVMIELLKELGWNYIGLVHENDLYGREGAKLLQTLARKAEICIAERLVITSNYMEILNRMVSRANPLKGIVFIARKNATKLFLEEIRKSKILEANFQFVFSESIGLGKEVLSTYRFSRGAILVSPTFHRFPSFEEHWADIVLNKAKRSEFLPGNPLLEKLRLTDDIDQYVPYAIIATASIARAIKDELERLCGDGPGICKAFKGMDPSNLIRRMQTTQFKLQEVLHALVNSSTGELYVSFNRHGEVVIGPDEPVYQIYNYSKNQSDFEFVQMAYFKNGSLHLEHGGSNTFRAVCPVREDCSECRSDDFPGKNLSLKGDFYLVGIVPMNDKGSGPLTCGPIRKISGLQIGEGIVYVVEKANKKTGLFQNVFPGKRLGLVLINSCDSEFQLQKKLLALLKGTLSGKISMVIGGLSSQISKGVSRILNSFGVLQISYGSTSAQLSDRDEYPNFMRICTSDEWQIRALLAILSKLKWNYISIVYADEAYGIDGSELLVSLAKTKKICVVSKIPYLPDNSRYSPVSILKKLRETPSAKGIILFLRSHQIGTFLVPLKDQMKLGEFTFIGTESWGTREAVIEKSEMMALGTITLLQALPVNKGFDDYLGKISVRNNKNNPWIYDYFKAKYNCYFALSFNKSSGQVCPRNISITSQTSYFQDPWASFAIAATQAAVLGMNKSLSELCGKDASLCTSFRSNVQRVRSITRNVTLDLYGAGKHKVFNKNGDGVVQFHIYNIHKRKESQSLAYVKVGYMKFDSARDQLELDESKLMFAKGKITSECPNNFRCKQCFPDKLDNSPKGSISAITIALSVMVCVLSVLLIIAISVSCFKFKKLHREDDYLHVVADRDKIYHDLPEIQDNLAMDGIRADAITM